MHYPRRYRRDKSNPQVYTSQEGIWKRLKVTLRYTLPKRVYIEKIKNNPQVYTTWEGKGEIKNHPKVYATWEGKGEIKSNPRYTLLKRV